MRKQTVAGAETVAKWRKEVQAMVNAVANIVRWGPRQEELEMGRMLDSFSHYARS